MLVTPVWNDSTRLAKFGEDLAEALAATALPIRWIIADDGSGFEEVGRLEKLAEKWRTTFAAVAVLPAASHLGKGGTVRNAWAAVPDAAWYAFVDADGAVSARDMLHLISMAVGEEENMIAIRKTTEETEIVESPWRSVTHHGFLWAADFLLGLKSADTQCGAKVLKGGDFRAIHASLREDGYAFDAELLFQLTLRSIKWREIPVSWTEKSGGKIRPIRDGIKMLATLWRIRRNAGKTR